MRSVSVGTVAVADLLSQRPLSFRPLRCLRSHLHEWCYEPEAPPVRRPEIALLAAIVAECPPSGGHGARDRRVGDEAALPDGIDQLVLRDHPVATLDQVKDQVEDLRLDPQRRAGRRSARAWPQSMTKESNTYRTHAMIGLFQRLSSGLGPAP